MLHFSKMQESEALVVKDILAVANNGWEVQVNVSDGVQTYAIFDTLRSCDNMQDNAEEFQFQALTPCDFVGELNAFCNEFNPSKSELVEAKKAKSRLDELCKVFTDAQKQAELLSEKYAPIFSGIADTWDVSFFPSVEKEVAITIKLQRDEFDFITSGKANNLAEVEKVINKNFYSLYCANRPLYEEIEAEINAMTMWTLDAVMRQEMGQNTVTFVDWVSDAYDSRNTVYRVECPVHFESPEHNEIAAKTFLGKCNVSIREALGVHKYQPIPICTKAVHSHACTDNQIFPPCLVVFSNEPDWESFSKDMKEKEKMANEGGLYINGVHVTYFDKHDMHFEA